MKWISHILIAGAICAVINPLAVPAAVAGSTAPDWFEKISRMSGRKTKHRAITHYLTYWLLGMAAAHFLWDWRDWIFWFCAGGAIHWACDALTITGAPVGPWSLKRMTLFGGRVRTGGTGEYLITFAVVALCLVFAWQQRGLGLGTNYIPFFPLWPDWYHSGHVDAKEWKEHRFSFF
jgi:inner membrane protein